MLCAVSDIAQHVGLPYWNQTEGPWHEPQVPWHEPQVPWHEPQVPWHKPQVPWHEPQVPWHEQQVPWSLGYNPQHYPQHICTTWVHSIKHLLFAIRIHLCKKTELSGFSVLEYQWFTWEQHTFVGSKHTFVENKHKFVGSTWFLVWVTGHQTWAVMIPYKWGMGFTASAGLLQSLLHTYMSIRTMNAPTNMVDWQYKPQDQKCIPMLGGCLGMRLILGLHSHSC